MVGVVVLSPVVIPLVEVLVPEQQPPLSVPETLEIQSVPIIPAAVTATSASAAAAVAIAVLVLVEIVTVQLLADTTVVPSKQRQKFGHISVCVIVL